MYVTQAAVSEPTFVAIQAVKGLHEEVGAATCYMDKGAFFAQNETGGDCQAL